MVGFSLLQKIKQDLQDPPKPPSGIQYQQYDVIVENENITVNIPLRETQNFETHLLKLGTDTISRKLMKQMLRKYRGTQG